MKRGSENFQAAGVERTEGIGTGEDVEGCAAPGAGFGESEDTGIEGEGGEESTGGGWFGGGFGRSVAPVQPAGDHEVQGEPEVVFEADGDAFANAEDLANGLTVSGFDRRGGGAQKERAKDGDAVEAVSDGAGGNGFDVECDVGQFGHINRIAFRSQLSAQC